MEALHCPRCKTEMDLDRCISIVTDRVGFEIAIEDTAAKPPAIDVRLDDTVDCEIVLSCPRCIWWVYLKSSIDIDTDSSIDGEDEVNSRLKPLTTMDAYDDATELWAEEDD